MIARTCKIHTPLCLCTCDCRTPPSQHRQADTNGVVQSTPPDSVQPDMSLTNLTTTGTIMYTEVIGQVQKVINQLLANQSSKSYHF